MAGFQASVDDPAAFRNVSLDAIFYYEFHKTDYVIRYLMWSNIALNQFREFLETYNKITEACFGKCVQNLNRGALYDDEASYHLSPYID